MHTGEFAVPKPRQTSGQGRVRASQRKIQSGTLQDHGSPAAAAVTRLTHITIPDAPRTRKGIRKSVHTLLDRLKIVPLSRLVFDKPRRARSVACGPEPEVLDLGRGVEHELGDCEVPKWGKVQRWDWGVEFHAWLVAVRGSTETRGRRGSSGSSSGRSEKSGLKVACNQKSAFQLREVGKERLLVPRHRGVIESDNTRII